VFLPTYHGMKNCSEHQAFEWKDELESMMQEEGLFNYLMRGIWIIHEAATLRHRYGLADINIVSGLAKLSGVALHEFEEQGRYACNSINDEFCQHLIVETELDGAVRPLDHNGDEGCTMPGYLTYSHLHEFVESTDRFSETEKKRIRRWLKIRRLLRYFGAKSFR
jgi:hypothetical protein